jgi:hypothetical protein
MQHAQRACCHGAARTHREQRKPLGGIVAQDLLMQRLSGSVIVN